MCTTEGSGGEAVSSTGAMRWGKKRRERKRKWVRERERGDRAEEERHLSCIYTASIWVTTAATAPCCQHASLQLLAS